MDNGSKHTIYGFDRFRLDVDILMLYDGETAVQLPPKCVNTLAVLVGRAGEVISKDDLIDAVWKDSIVEESNLSQYLYLLRKTLGNRQDGQPYIETLRRRGYRFNGEPVLIEPTPKSPPHPQPTARAESSRVMNFKTEPRGNVVALAEWKEPEQIKPDASPKIALAPRPPALTITRRWPLATALLAILLVSGTGYFFYNRSSAAPTQQPRDISILRLTNGLAPGGASISPDGKYFAYSEQSGEVYRLWLQQTGYSSRVEIIPPSEKLVNWATFSPDSQFVYYLAWDSSSETYAMYRVPTLGGPAKKVLNHVGSFSLSPDGREVVYGRYDKQKNEMQYAINASDGSGEERIIHSVAGWYSSGPAWSSDGKTIVFARELSGNPDVGNLLLTALNVEDGSLKPVSDETWDSCYRMMWSSDGRGFYFIGTKKGESMTPRRDQLYYVSYSDGRSRLITNDGTSRQQINSLGVTKDGSVLTVPYNRASQIWAMDANGDSRSAVQITSGLNDGRAGLAPLADGRVAYITRQGDNLNIWMMNQDGSDQKPLVVEPPLIVELSSSRSSRYLMFASLVDPAHFHMFRVNLDGSDSRQLTFGDGREEDPSISNDGHWVAYTQKFNRDKEVDASLWKMPVEGGEPVRLSQQRCELPRFSPDDKLLSCTEDYRTLHILSADSGTLVRTLSIPPLAEAATARWTPDGKSLAYIVTEKGVSNIWLHPIGGGEPKRLTDFNIASIYNFAYSLDGKRLFLARGQQIRDAVLIKGAG